MHQEAPKEVTQFELFHLCANFKSAAGTVIRFLFRMQFLFTSLAHTDLTVARTAEGLELSLRTLLLTYFPSSYYIVCKGISQRFGGYFVALNYFVLLVYTVLLWCSCSVLCGWCSEGLRHIT